jgi:glutaredoxin
VKEFLSQAGLAYTARNIEEDDTAYDELIALGFRTIPVTVIGDAVVKGFDADALDAAIAASRGRG